MTLSEFLRTKTNALELCAVTEGGWIAATFWIDHEDLFCRHLSPKLAGQPVKRDYWDYLTIVNANNASIKVPCHFIDV